jgi:hypothetical protein
MINMDLDMSILFFYIFIVLLFIILPYSNDLTHFMTQKEWEAKMKDQKNEKQDALFSLPKASSSELRGRQSVRATFKLSRRAIDAISIVSVHLGIKQKSLLDHLIDDDESLGLIAREIRSSASRPRNRVQKTFVVSRKTLSCLEKISRHYDTPRDALLEYSIQRLLPLIDRERERHNKREEILKEMRDYLSLGDNLLNKAKNSLGSDDTVTEELRSSLKTLSNTLESLESFVNRGRIIEDF